jgi:tetratricopeptide (TPR) repeat protein
MFRTAAIALALCAAAAGQSGSDDFATNHQAGESYVKRGDLRQAVPHLRRAFEIDPSNYDNGYDLALACLETKDVAGARHVIESMLKLGERSELHNLLGDVEEASGHIVQAVREYEIAARADPSEKNVFDLGTELLNHAGYQQAIQIFEFAVGRFPKSAKFQVGLGVAYYSTRRYPEAVKSLCAAVDLDPADTRALDFLGKLIDVSPEMAEEVSRRLAHFVQLYPGNASANYYYALSLQGRAKPEQVEELLTRAIKADATMADAYYQLGILYQDQGEANRAIQQYRKAVELRPGFKAAHYRLSSLYRSLGQEEGARKELDIFRSLSKADSQPPAR